MKTLPASLARAAIILAIQPTLLATTTQQQKLPLLPPHGLWLRSPTKMVGTSPFPGEDAVALSRETILTFDQPLDPVTVGGQAVAVEAAGQTLGFNLHVSEDGKRISIFYHQLLPASSAVRVTVDGSMFADGIGRLVDPDGDGIEGGIVEIEFATVSLTPVPGTAICGRVFASELDPAGGSINVPLEGATVRVDGAEDTLFAVTDNMGNFRLDPCPGARFFVHIDGTTAVHTALGVYPSVGKAWDPIPGQELSIGEIYLPLVIDGALQDLVPGQDTTVTLIPEYLIDFPELADIQVIVPADSLFADDGSVGTKVGIAPVAPDRLPGQLPPGLDFPVVITVQTDGATNFDEPASVVLPNLDGLEPGEKSALWSFNHDKGWWEVVAPMTVSADGQVVVTDPGYGIRAPGWHGTRPGSSASGGAPEGTVWEECVRAWGKAAPGCLLLLIDRLGKGVTCGLTLASGVVSWHDQCIADPDCNIELICCYFSGLKAVIDTAICAIGNSFGMYWSAFGCGWGMGQALCTCAGVNCNPGSSDFDLLVSSLVVHSERTREVAEAMTLLFGDSVWLSDPGPGDDSFSDWNQLLGTFVAQGSEEGMSLSSAEEIALSLASLPPQLNAGHVQTFVARHNRTIDYWNQGIFTERDVPPNQSTDFVQLDVLELEFQEALNAIEANQADGYDGIFGGIPELSRKINQGLAPALGDGVKRHEQLRYLVTTPDASLELRGTTTEAGAIGTLILPPESPFLIQWLSPSDFLVGTMVFESGPSGSNIQIPTAVLYPSDTIDSDGDGITDEGEMIVGTDSQLVDTDGDGIWDGDELQQGLDPLDGTVVTVGIIASIGVNGGAQDVAARDETIVVASGPFGVSIFNAFNGMEPLLVAQVDTPGDARRVALANGYVAVADGPEGLVIIDIRDVQSAAVIHQVDLGGAAEAVAVAGDVAYFGFSSGTLAAVELKTGAVFEEVGLGSAIHDLAIAGSVLYALTTDEVHALPVLQSPLQVSGSAPMSDQVFFAGTRRLFVGGGLAFATRFNGYDVFDLTVPNQPSLCAIAAGPQTAWRQLVSNGSGLGIGMVGLGSPTGNSDLDIYDLSDPKQTDLASMFQTTIPTPGRALSTTLYNGFAYVADEDAGLHVVNYLAFDTLGVPPFVSLETSVPGIQAEEGSLVFIEATADDDIQIRNVELLIDGEVIQTDGNFPFEFFQRMPLLTAQTQVSIQVRASDTGGNRTESAPLVLDLVPDLTSPTVLSSVPGDGDIATQGSIEGHGFNIVFSEAMDEASVLASVGVLSAGPDGSFGTADDVVLDIDPVIIDQERRLIVKAASVPLGFVRLTLDGSVAIDGAGNFLDGDDDGTPGGEYEITVTTIDAVFWAVDASGAWDDPGNWSTGAVPGPLDDVLIDRPAGDFTITINAGYVTVNSLDCSESVLLSGGTFSALAGLVQSRDLTITGGVLANTTIDLIGGAKLKSGTNGNSRLRDVIVNGDIEVTGTNAALGIDNVVLTGTLLISGNKANLGFEGDNTWSSGTIQLTGNTFVSMIQPGTLTIGPGGTIRGGGGQIGPSFVTGWDQAMVLVNEGSIVASGGSLTIDASGGLTNKGTLSAVTAGTLTLAGMWSNAGTIAADNASVVLAGNFPTAAIGSLSAANGTIVVAGVLDNSAAVLVLGPDSGSWKLNGGTIHGGTIDLTGGSPLKSGTNGNSRLRDVIVNGDIEVTGTNAALGIDNVVLTGTLLISGNKANLGFEGDNTWSSGTIQLTGNTFVSMIQPGTLTIGPGGTIRGGGQVGPSFVTGWDQAMVLVNEGSIVASGGSLTIDASGGLINNGTVVVTSTGLLSVPSSFSSDGDVIVQDSATLSCVLLDLVGGQLSGAGTISGDVRNGAAVLPGGSSGVLSITGSYEQTSAGRLVIDLDGLSLGAEYDRLAVGGTVILDGLLEIVVGFQPALADTFDVMTYASVMGVFSSVTGTNLGGGFELEVDYGADLTLEVVSGG